MLSKKEVFTCCLILTIGSLYAQPQIDSSYYKSGKLRSIKRFDLFNGVRMPVDTDTLFYESGSILKTIHYSNHKSRTETGGHATWTTIHSRFFYPNGKIRKVTYSKSCYECEPCACGAWTIYNEKGSVISSKQFGDCDDQQPCK